MTSEEIKSIPQTDFYATEGTILVNLVTMVQEIAYQLAVMNERAHGCGGSDLPVTPGRNSHTFHYTPDPETK